MPQRLTKSQQAYRLIIDSQRHFRYSQNCKRADYHRTMQKDCIQRAMQLMDEVRREQRIVQGRLDGLYQ